MNGDWRPAASLRVLRRRAAMLAEVRAFFAARRVLEVETPLLSAAAASDPAVESFVTCYAGPGVASGCSMYLNGSPEFAMKRLLAAGSGPIYQICKAFRQGEAGRHHNPEFTLLEWYRPGFDHRLLMDEVEELLRVLLPDLGGGERLSYREAFRRHAGIDPLTAEEQELAKCAASHGLGGVAGPDGMGVDGWLDLLMSHLVQPRLGREGPCFLFDYPASQAALARIRPGTPPVAERFELFLRGVELANGFHELLDHEEQRRRFDADLQRRARAGQPLPPLDRNLLAALSHGLPSCSGVALGLDRVLMLMCGAEEIGEVLAFPIGRA
ncbi:MAG TPA: EF-P lysine aminoacylase GenX [Gammaproteobacteria bacterium]|nr:EF-P lysine aminoacylase GenX [Gammaproteobacteria bacterium]